MKLKVIFFISDLKRPNRALFSLHERMEKMKVKCNSCKRDFKIENVKTEDMGNGVERTFFSCPFCGHKYTGFYTDESIRNLQKKIQKAVARLGNDNYDQKVLKKRVAKLQQKTKGEIDALKTRMKPADRESRNSE